MCASCYTTDWKRQNPEKMAARVQRMATCHPDRPVLARDLCSTCYRRERRAEPEYIEHEREWSREWQRQKREAQTPRERFLRVLRRYGLTFETYTEWLIAQSGRCAACNEPDPDLEIDHCHERGLRHVRGLLCHNCNSTLGHAKEDVNRLLALIDYLLTTG